MTTAPDPPPVADGDLVWVPGGTFLMGSADFYPEERPVLPTTVEGVWFDRHPVTNTDFAAFVDATGYVTVAERPLRAEDYPGALPELLVPGGLVFQPTDGPVNLDDYTNWWAYVPGATWRTPRGPGSGIEDLGDHPVVQVAYEDAETFASWRGAELPSEAEWEHAARGGLEGAAFCWGDEPYPQGRQLANTWQGEFPWQNLALDGWEGTSPVGSFPPNPFGLVDMAGNVWEWTSDWWQHNRPAAAIGGCCSPSRPQGSPPGGLEGSLDPDAPLEQFGRRVIKGGSHLCAPNYCLRFRPAARQPESVDTSTCHIGFRCVRRDLRPPT